MTEHGTELLNDPIAERLLTSTLPAQLAYVWRDGTPRVVPIWFHWTGSQVVMASPSRAPKLRALRDGDLVSVTIDSVEWPYHVLSIFPEHAFCLAQTGRQTPRRRWTQGL
jgi:hypothetical protein